MVLLNIIKYFKILTYQVLYLHGTKIAFIFNAIICLYLESIIGALLFAVLLASLFFEVRMGWKYSYLPMFLLAYLVMGLIYLCNLSPYREWMSKDYEWLGLYNSNSLNITYDLAPYILILLVAHVSRKSSSFGMFYKARVNTKETLEPIKEVVEDIEFDKDESEIKLKIDESNLSKAELPKENFENSHISGKKRFPLNLLKALDGSIIFSQQDDEQIIISLSKIWHSIEFFWYLYGFYKVLIAIMIIAFIKVNVISLAFMSFVGYNSFGLYIRSEFRTEKEYKNRNNLKFIQNLWYAFSSLLAIFSLLQYFNYMWFRPSWKINKPWEDFSFLCANEGLTIFSNNKKFQKISDYDYCVADWKFWLGIDNYNTRDIFSNFICVFMLLTSIKYLTDEEIFNRPDFVYKKEDDFTIIKQSRESIENAKYILFVLKSFILFYITIISIAYSHRYTNLIYGGFLFIAFYLFFKDVALNKKKNELWKYVQYYNYLVLVGVMLFQTPFLPCPVNRDGRSYIGLDE
jgi:hypothetical protein